MMNIENSKNLFFSIESKLGLFQWKCSFFHPWEYIRFDIFNEILIKKNIYSIPHDYKNKHIFLYIDKGFNLLKNLLFFNPYVKKNKAILIVGHSRKIFINGTYEDIYTGYFLNHLKKNYIYLDIPFQQIKHYPLSRKYYPLIYSDILHYGKKLSIKFKQENEERIKSIERSIEKNFQIKIDIHSHFNRLIGDFSRLYTPLNSFLKKQKPKIIIEVEGYSHFNKILNFFAKKHKIPVVELQHGNVSPFHIGYNYPENVKDLESFPHYFFTFGKYWSNNISLPINGEYIKTIGFPHFDNEIKKYGNIKRVKNTILFISQGTIGDKLSLFAYKLSKILPDNYKIIYKLHPGEYLRWKNAYTYLKNSRISVIDNNKIPLYKLFKENEYLIGVYSTAIYEGIATGMKVFLVNFPGIEYMKSLIKNNMVQVLNTPDNFLKLINKSINVIDKNEIFADNGMENFEQALKQILKNED